MNLNQIMNILNVDSIDGNEEKSQNERRGFMKQAGQFSFKAVLATLPVAFAMIPGTARAQSGTVIKTLNFALLLEYLERDFYKMALDSSGLIPGSDRMIFEQIYKHEAAHVEFLRSALGSAQGDVPVFDFTAGGMFPNAFTDYGTFLTLSQSFEDAGVRAYKGQAGNLMSADDILTAALQIHSVEARHASEVRRLRAERSDMMIKGWITGDESNGAPEGIYAGEANTTHATIDLNNIASLSDMSWEAKTEAFDEPLTFNQVFALVKPFVVKGT